jgi:hypothetical protein
MAERIDVPEPIKVSHTGPDYRKYPCTLIRATLTEPNELSLAPLLHRVSIEMRGLAPTPHANRSDIRPGI